MTTMMITATGMRRIVRTNTGSITSIITAIFTGITMVRDGTIIIFVRATTTRGLITITSPAFSRVIREAIASISICIIGYTSKLFEFGSGDA